MASKTCRVGLNQKLTRPNMGLQNSNSKNRKLPNFFFFGKSIFVRVVPDTDLAGYPANNFTVYPVGYPAEKYI